MAINRFYKRVTTLFKERPRWDYLLLGAGVALIACLNLIWRHIELRPPHWDMARHLLTGLQYLDLFKHHDPNIISAYFYYPPLVYWVAVPFQILFHPSIESAVASNVVFVAILAYATYELGRTLWSRRTGLLASFLVLTTPMMASQFKEYQVDAPLAAMTALALLFLVKSKNFTVHKYSLLFGASLGLGMLTKWTFPFIMLAPLAFMIVGAGVKLVKSRNLKIVYNALAAAVLTYAIAGVWYVTNYHQIKIDLTQNSTAAGIREGDPVVGTLASNMWHINNLVDNHLRLVIVLLVVGLVLLFVKRRNLKQNAYPLLLFLGTMIFFTMLRNKDARYILPALPAAAILCVYWFDQLKRRWRVVATVSLLLYGAVVFWSVSFGVPFLPKDISLKIGNQSRILYAQNGYIIGAPTRERWYQEEAFKYIAEHGGRKTVAYFGDDTMWFNGWGLSYYSTLYKVGLVGLKDKPEYLFIRTQSGGKELVYVGQIVKMYRLPDGSVLKIVKANY